MDVRIGYPNEHLAGSAKNEINQPMYSTSVGLIMRGFEYLETYKKTFIAGKPEDFIQTKTIATEQPKDRTEKVVTEEEDTETFAAPVHEEEKISLTDKIKSMLSKMFEVEDQPINK